MKIRLLAAAALILAACTPKTTESLTQYVDPRIGSGGHGHVFVGASVPFGMVQLGPTSIPQEWDWTSGYHASDSTVIGFSHTHLEGTGIGDLFDVTLMPVIGEVTYARGNYDGPQTGLWSYADRSKEVARPSYYSVPLTRWGITAELTATARVGMHRYTFPAASDAAIVIDLQNGGCWDSATDTGFELVGDRAIQGRRRSTGWANDQHVYFYAEFSEPFTAVFPNDRYARLGFGDLAEGKQILVKVALSPVSVEGARAAMTAELPGWDFEATCRATDTAWNKELSRIRISGEDPTARTIFYTALYHTMIHPAVFNDIDGKYRGADGEVHQGDFTNYTIFSLWDTYRAAMPLLNIIHPDKADDMVRTMVRIYDEQGKLPVWHLWGCETDCMVGNPGAIAVADALVKGYDGFDKEHAYEALKNSIMLDERGQDLRKQYGYIPSDLYNESIGNDMEYAIADAAVAHAAAYLGKTEDAVFFTERSHSYRHYMDPETLNARGRFADGSWRTPFNPFVSNHREQMPGSTPGWRRRTSTDSWTSTAARSSWSPAWTPSSHRTPGSKARMRPRTSPA